MNLDQLFDLERKRSDVERRIVSAHGPLQNNIIVVADPFTDCIVVGNDDRGFAVTPRSNLEMIPDTYKALVDQT